jgi:hypothetical protein
MIVYSASLQAETEHVWVHQRSDTMHKRHTDNSKALAAFIAKKAEIDTMLARLAALSASHFEADPSTVHWGHVGTLEYYATQMKRITDAAFKEGEHAE